MKLGKTVYSILLIGLLINIFTAGNVFARRYTEYQIKPKDIIEIKFYRNSDLNQEEMEVSPRGNIYLPLIGEVTVEGLTITEIEKKLMDMYSHDYLNNPYITVSILSRRYYVLGEVKSPGSYSMVGNVTVLNAITHAGGFTDYAAKNRVSVIRSKGANKEKETIRVNIDQIIKKGDTSLDVILQPDDVVNVPESAF